MLKLSDRMVLKELMDGNNWKPNLSEISKRLNMPISTVSDRYQKLKEIINVKVEQKDLNELIEGGENDE